jgi:hypothetical protein
MFQNYYHNSFTNSFFNYFYLKSIQLNLERNNGRDDRRRKFLENDNKSRRWIFRISNPTQQQFIRIRHRIITKSLCARVMSNRDPQNNYVVELVGVAEFNTPHSLN